jgi:DNA polymerase I
MTTSRPMFFVIDGHALAYRQFFALKPQGFTTHSGEMTNATYGFTRTVLDILQKDRPQYLAVSFDMGLSGRENLYTEYKGTREKMPDELRDQIERINQIVAAFNIPILAVETYEADDVIGTIVGQAEAEGVDVRIITGDRDLLQLLTPHITVQLPDRSKTGGGTDVVYDEALYREKYQLEHPWQLVDFKALVGDASDNIPGVKGIGDKTAISLMAQYESLDNIYAHVHELKGAVQKNLTEGKEMAYLSQDLATIRRNVPIQLVLSACVAHDFDHDKVAELFRELEFRQLAKRLFELQDEQKNDNEEFAAPEEAVYETVIIRDQAGLDNLVETLNAAKGIVWDVETTGLDHMACDLVGIALAVNGNTGYYVPVGHGKGNGLFDMFEKEEQLPLETVINALRGPMTNPNIPKFAHNAGFDLVVMQRHGIDVTPITFDTMIAEFVRDPMSKFLGLKNFVSQYLKVHMQNIEELIGTGKKQITMDQVPVDRAAPYAAADAAMTFRAVEFLRPYLEAEPGLLSLFNNIEMPLVPIIAAIESAGVVLDTPYLAQLSQKLDQELKMLEDRIYELTGGYGKFNINSTKQLNDVLFGKLNLSVKGLRKTQHGFTTDAATLENLRGDHPIIEHILTYRELTKLKGTYVDALPALVNAKTGRLHTNYNQTGAATGRMSSNNPNLQNIPIRTEVGREVRRAFITPPGTRLLSVDYSQIELRVLAHYSEDPTLLEAFRQNQDIHAVTAAAVYSIPLEQVTFEQRSFAKRVNFGLIYGMGAYRLSRDSDLSVGEARDFIETYFNQMPQVKRYLDDTKQLAREGVITTLFGRRREFPILQRPERYNVSMVQGEERVAINMPIQGSAADIMKKAMIDLYRELARHKLKARMILQVHDELVLEVPEDELAEAAALTVQVMENVYPLKAPLRANAQVGTNWRDMSPLIPS